MNRRPPRDIYAPRRYPPAPNNTPVSPSISPQVMGVPMGFPVKCAWCLIDHYPSSTKTLDSNYVCHNCICEQFEKAVASEDAYPLKWSSIELTLEDHQDILSPELANKFKAKEKEYQTPAHKRIYCKGKEIRARTGEVVNYDYGHLNLGQGHLAYVGGVTTEACGAFLGAIKSLGDRVEIAKEKNFQVNCKDCTTIHCLICGEAYIAGGHKCSGISPSHFAAKEIPPEWIRGKEYQICPSSFCERLIELIDGCNHCICKCGQNFCFVCGEPAAGNGPHWDRAREHGGCPQFNHPSQPNANWARARPPDDGLDAFVQERYFQQHMQEELRRHQDRMRQAVQMQQAQQAQQAQRLQQRDAAQTPQLQQSIPAPERRRDAFSEGSPPLNPTAADYVPEGEPDFESRFAIGHTQERRNAIAGPAAGLSWMLAPQEFDGQMGIPRARESPILATDDPEHDEFVREQLARISRNNDNDRGGFQREARQPPIRFGRYRQNSLAASGGADQAYRPAHMQRQTLEGLRARHQRRTERLPRTGGWGRSAAMSQPQTQQPLEPHRDDVALAAAHIGGAYGNLLERPHWSAQTHLPASRQHAIVPRRAATAAQYTAVPNPIGFGAPSRVDQPTLPEALVRELQQMLQEMAVLAGATGAMTTQANVTQRAHDVLATNLSPQQLDSANSWVQDQLQNHMSRTYRLETILSVQSAWDSAMEQMQAARPGVQNDTETEEAGF